jgi:hypothetical protein
MTAIYLGNNVFNIYNDFLSYYCPALAAACHSSTLDRPAQPLELEDIDLDVFGLFIQWIYSQKVTNEEGEPAFQHQLMQLWVLAERLNMPALQNDAIDGIQARRLVMGEEFQTKTFNYIYANTIKGAMLRKYLVDICVPRLNSLKFKVLQQHFPKEMLDEIAEWKGKAAREMDMDNYHVVVD